MCDQAFDDLNSVKTGKGPERFRGRKSRTIVLLLLCGWLMTGPVFPRPAQPVSPDSPLLKELIREALNNNPGLEAAYLKAQSAESAVSQAGLLPDPRLTLGLMNVPVDSFSFRQEPMTGKMLSVSQMFPFPGKLGLSKAMARSAAAAENLMAQDVRGRIINAVRKAYYTLYGMDRAMETVDKNIRLVRQLISTAEAKYVSGKGLQFDILRAQVEMTRLEDDALMWKQKRRAAVSRLNAVLGRPAETDFSSLAEVLDPPLEDVLPPESEETEQRRPLLQAMKSRLDRMRQGVDLARKNIWPDFVVGASYSQRDDRVPGGNSPDFLSATLSFSIPLFAGRKQKAAVVEKELALASGESEYRDALTGILAETRALQADMERYRRRLNLYRDALLIQARQSLESAQAGYEVGQVDFMTVISNRMMLESYELQYHITLSEYYKSLSDYDFLIGLTSGEDITPEKATGEDSKENHS